MSEGTVANWNDVQNWEEGNDQQEVWHEWDTMLLNHNYNAWAAVSNACVCGHTPAPTQFTGCWVGYHRPQARGNGPEQGIDDNQWCAQNYNNFCQC